MQIIILIVLIIIAIQRLQRSAANDSGVSIT